jgi:hypothetical protein
LSIVEIRPHSSFFDQKKGKNQKKEISEANTKGKPEKSVEEEAE